MKIDPEEVIYAITVLDLLRAMERRIGKEEASNLSDADQALLTFSGNQITISLAHGFSPVYWSTGKAWISLTAATFATLAAGVEPVALL